MHWPPPFVTVNVAAPQIGSSRSLLQTRWQERLCAVRETSCLGGNRTVSPCLDTAAAALEFHSLRGDVYYVSPSGAKNEISLDGVSVDGVRFSV